MDIDKETEKQIQELQMLENSLQNTMMQKQAFMLELSEVENASAEISKSEDEVFKIVGQVMIKSKKSDLLKELAEKKELLSARLKSIDSQEQKISEKADDLRQKVLAKIQK